MNPIRLLPLLLLTVLAVAGCVGERHTIVQVDSSDPALQQASPLYDDSGESWKRIYDPETYRWYRAEYDEQSGRWVIAGSARANRERILSILEDEARPLTERPVILHNGLLLVEEVTGNVQRVTRLDIPFNPPSWFRMYNPTTDDWYEAYLDEPTNTWRFTPDAMLQIELDLEQTTAAGVDSMDNAPLVYDQDKPAPESGAIQSLAAPAESMDQLPSASARPENVTQESSSLPDLPGHVAITALDKTWVSVIKDEGERTDYYMRDGDRLDISFTRSLQLILGNADAVTLSYNGAAYSTRSLNDTVVTFPPTQSSQ